ncbi:hypothetical protein KDD93_08455 [Campylobacter sp. faydin G-24]|uniref:Uncharacterized protein n=1 Tax=Campylobacter anatolicus TaxID=2829105 RepID=A0ABS5HJZ4_9BACT|nr:hypothetical protein [Campylobacter anatolicus]MBR8464588.1 hypothetical protein [Campylobacter anatolicus]MBR8465724.1 hypothetical protein [Campylobacter anatolicus]
MTKILVATIVLFIIYIVFFKAKKQVDERVENFVECGKCGTFVDIKESILRNGKYICKDCEKEN